MAAAVAEGADLGGGGDLRGQLPPVGAHIGSMVMSSSELAEALARGEVDMQDLQDTALQVASRLATDPREQLAKERLFRRGEQDDAHAPGSWVRLQGLQTEGLNGREGLVVQPLNEAGRVGVAVPRFGSKAIKPCNLAPFAEEETMKVARLFCKGEKGTGVRTWRWPLRVIADRPFFSSPVSESIGMLLHVTRCEPDRALNASGDFDSQWAGHLMMDPKTGRVPHDWANMPGPLIVWRADGEDFSADDLCLVVCFVDGLLLRYGDKENPFDVEAEVTWEAFQEFKRREMEIATDDSDRLQWWEDINV